jgi:hypothetical protein
MQVSLFQQKPLAEQIPTGEAGGSIVLVPLNLLATVANGLVKVVERTALLTPALTEPKLRVLGANVGFCADNEEASNIIGNNFISFLCQQLIQKDHAVSQLMGGHE